MTTTMTETICPTCGGAELDVFYGVDDVPTNSVLLLETSEEALAIPRGQIRMAFCRACGHIHNAAFDHALTEYSGRYESTQGYSPTFNAFHERLANDMVERFDLRGKRIIEIGCGNGEFLVLLCAVGGNRGLGFDPAYLPGRVPVPPGTEIEFVADFYSERYTDRPADFIECKMTLEHIVDTSRFIGTVRAAIGDRLDTMVCFQVPNARYVIGEQAFWDVYYEHCSYFSHGSLARLFRAQRFDVMDLWTDYDHQYLMVAAKPTEGPTRPALPAEDDLDQVGAEVAAFASAVPAAVNRWKADLRALRDAGKRTVLWGGGSKGVAFLTTIGLTDEITAVVDVNPHKAGTFMAGSGHEIVSPAALEELRPDVVIVMNPVYRDEIARDLASRGLTPDLRSVE